MRIRGRVRPLAAVVLLAAGLAGCTTPQLAQPEAGLPVPEEWQETDVATASLDLATYWRQLDDPLLTEFVEAAAAHNLDLAQSAARLEQARAQLRGARASWMPQLSVNGRASQEFSDQFHNLWRYYLMYCEGGFRGGGIDVAQVTMVKA